MKNLYCIIGKSGTGKDTIVNELCRTYGYSRVISYTSRPKRTDPKDAYSHIFVPEDDYHKAKASGTVVAETDFDGNYYWVTKEQVDKHDLYIIDWAGYVTLKERYKDKPIKLIIIKASEDVRRQRMLKRGDSAETVDKRIEHDEIAFAELFKTKTTGDLIISNDFNGNIRGLCRTIYQEIKRMEASPKSNRSQVI